ncbi:MAG TPA: hypothetical protein VMT90_05390 [Dehalococcoidia bacterium]|jgi:uncharacterized protein involved in exopolysaccharide biosynthesis|nr:hypothetical protein [Dehalococcoidia bacterium]
MSYKALDTLFRHKFLVILPLVVLITAGLAGSALRSSHVYSSTTRAWAQSTPFLQSSLAPDNPYLTPAQAQAQTYGDLLKLDSFVLDVASRVDGLKNQPSAVQAGEVRSRTYITPEGVNVLSITHQSADPALTKSVVEAIIAAYADYYKTDVVAQGDAAIAFYQARLDTANQELTQREKDVADYQATLNNPIDSESGTTDPKLAELQSLASTARDDYNNLLDKIDEINIQKEAAVTGKDIGFRVQDEAKLPTSPLPTSMKDVLLLPMLGLLLGISASGLLLFALIRLDDRIRLPEEVRAMGLPVVGLPDISKRQRSWPQHFVRLTVMVSRGLLGGSS